MQRAWCPGVPYSEPCSQNRRLSRELQPRPHLPLLRLWAPRSPGLRKGWRPSGKAASSPRIPVGPLGATSAWERAGTEAWARGRPGPPHRRRRSGIKQRPGTPSGHPGSGGHGGRGEAETMQRVDRWAGNPRPRRGQPPAWARGPRSHLWKRGCSPSLTEKPARPEPLIVREGGPLQRHTSPTCAPHRGQGQHSKRESGGRLRNPPTPPSRLLPGTGPGDRARGREPPRLPGADGRGGHASSCHSGLRPGKAVPCGVQRRAALTGRGWQHIS